MTTRRERLEKMIAFEKPAEGSHFHDIIINRTVPHGHRDEPAWMYAIKDAERGAALEYRRLAPLLALLPELSEVLEDAIEVWPGDKTHERGIVAKMREVLRKLDEVIK